MTDIRHLMRAVLALAVLAAGPTEAAGGGQGGGQGGAGSEGQKSAPTCERGYVVKDGACTQVRSGLLPDDELYRQGRALARAHHFAEALPILDAITRRDDTMVYTMLGFTLRKLGRADEGLALYAKALALDPRNADTHEYLGEYYVEIGDLDRARTHLATLAAICGGPGCEQYDDLAKAIETGKTE